ncbi:MAG: hypothetical protein N2167_03370 [Flavobacteriales bacterium]|nr:hypothetical protein [Flavobacteriales bacterium]
MFRIILIIIISGLGLQAAPRYKWVCAGKGFSVLFPSAYHDTTMTIQQIIISRAYADDAKGNHYVAECKKLMASIPTERYKNDWKKYHDEILKEFVKANHLEKTEEERFDIGKYHGIYAILNHKHKRLTCFYRNIIINNYSITLYVIQPRSSINYKIVKHFFQSAQYRISYLNK